MFRLFVGFIEVEIGFTAPGSGHAGNVLEIGGEFDAWEARAEAAGECVLAGRNQFRAPQIRREQARRMRRESAGDRWGGRQRRRRGPGLARNRALPLRGYRGPSPARRAGWRRRDRIADPRREPADRLRKSAPAPRHRCARHWPRHGQRRRGDFRGANAAPGR